MGNPTGFIDHPRLDDSELSCEVRIANFEDFHTPLDRERRLIQASRCMDCGVPFCQSGMVIDNTTYGCPLANLIPEFNDALSEGNEREALGRLLKTNNFPEFTGRVCPAPCEAACVCGIHSDPVATKANELSIIEWAFDNDLMTPHLPPQCTRKRIAVVGSGPAGLAAADCLNQRGHQVTVFEKDTHLGGLLMYGIPEMKLPKSIISRRIDLLSAEGITFKTECEITRDIDAEELTASFDAVVLCCGSSEPRVMTFEGESSCSSGIVYAADYLKASTEALLDNSPSRISAQNKKVAIIGAGNTATDCVAVALRQGCTEVMQLVRRPKSAYEKSDRLFPSPSNVVYETEYGQLEAQARFGRDPRYHEVVVTGVISNDEGTLIGIQTKTSGKGSLEASTLPQNEPLPLTEAHDIDLLIIASGFCGCAPTILEAFNLPTDETGAITTSHYRVPDTSLFVAGDMRRGQSLVVWAIAEGRKAARAVDEYLLGYSNMR